MPRVPRYTIDALRDLDRQLAYAPAAARRRHLVEAERLIADLQPDRNYPEDFIVYRITGYRSEMGDPATFVGSALIRDLSSLITSLSDSLKLAAESARPAVTVEDAAKMLGVSTKTIHRYRRQGLICHYLLHGEEPRKRLCCYVDQLDEFAARHAERMARARKFTRLDDSAVQNIIRQARDLRTREDISLNEAARRIATEHNRAHETIRLLLRRHDESSDEPIFGAPGPLTDRQIRLIERAWRRDVPASRLAARFGKTRATIHRVINQRRAAALHALNLRWIDLPTFKMKDAEAVILTPRVVTAGLLDPPPSTHAIPLIHWAREQSSRTQEDEEALIAAYNALKRRAAVAIGSLGERPGSDELDRIETDLRWAGQLKRALVFIGLLAAILTIDRSLGRGLESQPTETIISLLADAFDACGRAVEQVNPARNQRVARLSGYLMDRTLASRTESKRSARAGARHVEGTIPLRGLVRRTVEWSRMVDLPEALIPFVDKLEPSHRRILERRYGLDGGPPWTIAEVCEGLEMSRLAVTNRLAAGRRGLRRMCRT